jgi:hypothetical protein
MSNVNDNLITILAKSILKAQSAGLYLEEFWSETAGGLGMPDLSKALTDSDIGPREIKDIHVAMDRMSAANEQFDKAYNMLRDAARAVGVTDNILDDGGEIV